MILKTSTVITLFVSKHQLTDSGDTAVVVQSAISTEQNTFRRYSETYSEPKITNK